jgi:hypothetical protein
MKEEIFKIEKILDAEFENLNIFKELSFQTIYSNLLYRAQRININSKEEIIDDLHRISLIYYQLEELSKTKIYDNSSEALMCFNNDKHNVDLEYIYSYAHFCMIMPQIHKNTFKVEAIEGNKIKIEYLDNETLYAEKIDRLYSSFSSPLQFNLKDKILEDLFHIIAFDNNLKLEEKIIDKLYNFHFKQNIVSNLLPDSTLINNLNFDNSDANKVFAFLKTISEYHIRFSNFYFIKGKELESDELIDLHLKNSICLYQKNDFFQLISKYTEVKRDKITEILSYLTDIYASDDKSKTNTYVGDGILAPLTNFEDKIVFSPYSLKHLSTFNNVLYSLNKRKKTIFDNHISKELEPLLITQVKELFLNFEYLELKKNITYTKGEIDIMVFSKRENTCIIGQVKATITPSNPRTVQRVEQRIYEAKKQIEAFNSLIQSEQQDIINNTFSVNNKKTKMIPLIILRSSAGSKKAWKINEKFKIVNFEFLKMILKEKKKHKKYNIDNIEKEIKRYQDKILKKAEFKTDYETLKINEYEITFPNINYNERKLLKMRHIK